MIPHWIVIIQSICFAILYAVWMLPKTIFLRNTCLGIGAALSIFVIYRYRKYFLSKVALPVYLLLGLFAWLVFHLFFLSNDYQAQYLELTSVWKNSAIGVIFALGFGIALSGSAQYWGEAFKRGAKSQTVIWCLIWLGLMLPELIYITKWILTNKAVAWGIVTPDYWKLWYGSAPYYISKNTYVSFCFPVLAIALGQIKCQLDRNQFLSFGSVFYSYVIASVLFVFWGERIFNGFIYSLLCTVILGCMLLWTNFKSMAINQRLLALIIICGLTVGLAHQVRSDSHYMSFIADAKVALDGEKYPQWKYNGERGHPKNEFGAQVNGSNYERVSWFIHGVPLIPRHPLGYGLLQSSFGHLVKMDYPDSKMHQTHSGWLDLTLGIGLPGVGFILGALLLAMRGFSQPVGAFSGVNISQAPQMQAYLSLGWWALLGLGLVWCTTELSQKLYIDGLLFWIALATGLGIGSRPYEIKQSIKKSV